MTDHAKLRALAEAATPGPWTTDEAPRLAGAVNAEIDGLRRQVARTDGQAAMFDDRRGLETHEVMAANAAFIAAANPAVVLDLLARFGLVRARASLANRRAGRLAETIAAWLEQNSEHASVVGRTLNQAAAEIRANWSREAIDADDETLLDRIATLEQHALEQASAMHDKVTSLKTRLAATQAALDEACDIAERRGAAIGYLRRNIDGYDGTKDVPDEIEHGTIDMDGHAEIPGAVRQPDAATRISQLRTTGRVR